MRFVDTNIPVYAVSTLPGDEPKQQIAETLLDRNDLAISPQVLGEFYHQVTRPSRPGGALSHNQAVRVIANLERHQVQNLTMNTVKLALEYREKFGLSYWDCLILATAKLGGCDLVYSEDMSQEQDYDGMRVLNPFAGLLPGT